MKIDPHTQAEVIFNKGSKATLQKKVVLSNNDDGAVELQPKPQTYINIYTKWTLEEDIEHLQDLGLGKEVLDLTSKA